MCVIVYSHFNTFTIVGLADENELIVRKIVRRRYLANCYIEMCGMNCVSGNLRLQSCSQSLPLPLF